jgi:arginyl-tRNA synthetase
MACSFIDTIFFAQIAAGVPPRLARAPAATSLKQGALITLKRFLEDLYWEALKKIAPDHVDSCKGLITVNRSKHPSHGDFSSNAALVVAKILNRNPGDVANDFLKHLPPVPEISKSESAGPGFINHFLTPAAKQQVVHAILASGNTFGCSNLLENKEILVEFVSANPTGPLHVGHGRGAAYGASLANILAAAGARLRREYYVNDAGRQMDILALSTWLRYLELANRAVFFPANAYQGEYVHTMARQIHSQHKDRYVRELLPVLTRAPSADADSEAHLDNAIEAAKTLLGEDYAYLHNFALTEQLEECRNDLSEFGVTFDSWFSESSLYQTDLVKTAVERLERHYHIYMQDGAKWFRSSRFGDEKDRVVQRDNGLYTYFASDIAYHLNKYERGFDQMINIWGADHHGYIPRVRAAIQAMDLDEQKLVIALVQFAILYRGGKKVSMSTRSGKFVTLRELCKEVGNDAARFFYVLRKSDQHLDFDLDLAKSQSNDNPVYYIQYAHARICSVLANWGEDPALTKNADPAVLTGPHELALMQHLSDFPDMVESAAIELSPHLIAYYLKELAALFHGYYNAEQFLVESEKIRLARLALITATRQVLYNGLALLGVCAPEKM